MFQNATEILTIIFSALIQRLFYTKPLPKDFTPKRILVVKLDHIGDVLLASPVFSNLRKSYPNTELHALTGTWSRIILENHPDVDKVLTYNSPSFCRSGQPTSIKETYQLYRQLRSQKYDLLVELRGDFRIACFSLFDVTPKRINRASLQIANRLGSRLFSGKHETTRNLDVLMHAGIPTPIQETTFAIAKQDEIWTSDFIVTQDFNNHDPLIAIHPGSPIPLKRWKPNRFAELADWLIKQKSAQVIFVGVEDEIPIIKKIQNLMIGESTNIAGKTTIPQLASILKKCKLFIGNDSGPMHLAAAVGTQTIGIYGPGDPTRFGPVGDKCKTIQKKLDCPPCSGNTCRLGEEGCMSIIQVTDVIQLIEESGYIH